MSINKKKTSSLILHRHLNYCCQTKQYYSNDTQILVKTLKIMPRVIVYHKQLKVNNTYETITSITNKGLYNRRLIYTTDSSDTTIRVNSKIFTDNFIEPDKSTHITVCIKPLQNAKINRRRHIYITSEHPNITFSIPIIILTNENSKISIPSSINFPKTVARNLTFYEMILYNTTLNKISFNIKCTHPNLTIHVNSLKILTRDYVRILLKLNCKDTEIIEDILKLKLDSGVLGQPPNNLCKLTGDTFGISFIHEPMQWAFYVDTLYINFEARFNCEETKEFRICNESERDVNFQIDFTDILMDDSVENPKHGNSMESKDLCESLLQTNTISTDKISLESPDKYGFRHFQIKPLCFTIPANSSFIVEVTFRPVMHQDFKLSYNELPPFMILSSLTVVSKDQMRTKVRQIVLKGLINGPDIEILPKTIDLRQVYFGEEHCHQITVQNIDGTCGAHVNLYDIKSRDAAHIIVTPKEGLNLKPYQSGVFHLQFYATVEGKFMIKMEFKVTNGGIYSMMIKGYAQHVRVKCFPNLLDFGVLPIAMPQKRLVLLMNPLSVPLTVQCSVMGDGYETPLVLNTHDVDEHLPINVKDPNSNACYSNRAEHEQDNFKDKEYKFETQCCSDEKETSLLSFRSVVEENSEYSTEFEEQALDLIPDISYNFLSHLKTIRIFDKPEMEKNVIEEALNALLSTPYFCDIDKFKNYTQMDWNSLATDPKEIYCNNEIIYLKPNTGKAISIVVIPNVVGYQHKYVALRVCPLMPPPTDDESPDLRQIVDSNKMISKLWIEYNCSIPEIIWDNVVIMPDKLYAGEWNVFEMTFENRSTIGGFFYYDLIPDSSIGTMKFQNKQWKYFIEPKSKISVGCTVKFKKLGHIVLAGLIKFVGAYMGYPYHIKSEVLPPKVKFTPCSIVKTIEVLELAKLKVYIENITPTTTWFKLKLKEEKHIFMEPCGGQLAPTGQATCTILNIFYRDPGTYKNILYIILQFDTIEKIPITIQVRGMPIFFEPELCMKDLNMGHLICQSEEEYHDAKLNSTKVIKVINKGLRSYRILITRTKCSAKPTCSVNLSKAKIIIKPNNFIVSPLSEDYFTVFTNSCEETSICNEFRIEIIDCKDPKRIQSQRFKVTATFIFPQLSWNRRDIIMNYQSTHIYKEQPQWESIKLTNNTDNKVECVSLKLTGPFKIRDLFEHQFVKELSFSIDGLETKEFFIMLDRPIIRNRLNTFYEGRLSCFANSRRQKSVYLKIIIYIPTLTLKQKDVVLFTRNTEGCSYIEIMNTGHIPATYKWKKLKEEWHYISQEDDAKQVAEIIIYDIICKLDFGPVNFGNFFEPNNPDLEDPFDIKNIIYNVIENLDLMERCYKLDYQEIPPPVEGSIIETKIQENPIEIDEIIYRDSTADIQAQIDNISNMSMMEKDNIFDEKPTKIEEQLQSHKNPMDILASSANIHLSSSEACAHHTFDHVMDNLNLDDSYVLSEQSTETCELTESVYFLEKFGVLRTNQRKMCALHIPPIRRGLEVRTAFQLDVVGGNSQKFKITLVNLDKTLKLSQDNIYLGLKPWYEQFKTKARAENLTNYPIMLNINPISRPIENTISKVVTGYLKMLNEKIIYLPALQNTFIKIEGIMGFSEDFQHELCNIINDAEKLILRLRGHGVMPILVVSNRMLPFVKQDAVEIIEEYRILQKIYYFKIFKPITEIDDELTWPIEEEESFKEIISITRDLTILSTSESKLSSESSFSTMSEKEVGFFRVLQTYVVANNEELPSSAILEQLMETEKFLNHLRYSTEASSLLNMVYKDFIQLRKGYDEKRPINLRHFTSLPLPFQLKCNILEMEKLIMNQYSKFIITLEFFGPGKLIASARTVIKIQGLTVDFKIIENTGEQKFIYYRSDNNPTNFQNISYRNMYERQMDAEMNPKIKHAHSYDDNKKLQHPPDISAKDRKYKMHYYKNFNKPIYMEQKYNFTHCKIFTNCKYNFSGTKMNVIILMRPQKTHYQPDQQIEDYLYIDLHMGPTLPILMRGTVVEKI